MADSLETLFKNLGPNTAAMWAGERQALDNYASEASTARQQQEINNLIQTHGQNELTNPLEVQNKQLVNQGLNAELAGKVANSSKLTTEADTLRRTQPGVIEAKDSENSITVLGNKIKKNSALTDILNQGASSLSMLPSPARHAAAYKQLLQMGGQEAVDEWKPKLDSIHGDKLPDAILAMGKATALNTADMQQKLEVEKLKHASAERVGAGNNAATRYGADQHRGGIEAGLEVKEKTAAKAKNLQADGTDWLNKARATDDPQLKTLYNKRAQESFAMLASLPGYNKIAPGDVTGMAVNPLPVLGAGEGDKNKTRSPEAQAALELLRKSQK